MITESNQPRNESPLKTLREMMGLTQQEFASLMGLAINTIARWEKGKGRPSFTPGQWRTLLAEMKRVNLKLDHLPDDLSPGNQLRIIKTKSR